MSLVPVSDIPTSIKKPNKDNPIHLRANPIPKPIPHGTPRAISRPKHQLPTCHSVAVETIPSSSNPLLGGSLRET